MKNKHTQTVDLVAKAEQIIADKFYKEHQKATKKRSGLDVILNLGMVVGCLFLAAVFVFSG